MTIPLLIFGGALLGAYLLGRKKNKAREKDLERQLNISESMRNRERRKSREELLEELKGE